MSQPSPDVNVTRLEPGAVPAGRRPFSFNTIQLLVLNLSLE